MNNDAVLLLLTLLGGGLGGRGASLLGGGQFDILNMYGILEVLKALMASRQRTSSSSSRNSDLLDPNPDPNPDPNRQGQQREV